VKASLGESHFFVRGTLDSRALSATGPVNHRARLLGSLVLGLLLLGAFEAVYSLSGRGSLYRQLRHAMGDAGESTLVNAGWMPLSDLERQRAAVSSCEQL
jgi:hypothetical protein